MVRKEMLMGTDYGNAWNVAPSTAYGNNVSSAAVYRNAFAIWK